jgi:hypothetical protein
VHVVAGLCLALLYLLPLAPQVGTTPKYRCRRLMSSRTGDQADRRNSFAMAQAGWAATMATVSVAAERVGQAHSNTAAAAPAAYRMRCEGGRAAVAFTKAVRDVCAAARERVQHMPAGKRARVHVFSPGFQKALADLKRFYSAHPEFATRFENLGRLVVEQHNLLVGIAVQALSTALPQRFMQTAMVHAVLQACLALRRYELAAHQASQLLAAVRETESALDRDLKSAFESYLAPVATARQVSSVQHTYLVPVSGGEVPSYSLEGAFNAARPACFRYASAEREASRAARDLSLAFAAAAAPCA